MMIRHIIIIMQIRPGRSRRQRRVDRKERGRDVGIRV